MPTNYQPGPAADVDAQREGDRWTLIFVRDLNHAPERVWRALTDPAELRQWAPSIRIATLVQPATRS